MASDLKVKTSPRPQSRLALEVLVPAERCRHSYDKALRNLCRTVRLPGFRPGRVPQTTVLQQLGTRQVWVTALEQLLEDTARDVLKDEDLELLGNLQLQDSFDVLAQQFNPGESLTLNMEADVRPHATLKAYQGLEVEVKELSVEEALEEILEEQRHAAGTTAPLEKVTAEMGDVAVVKVDSDLPSSSDSPRTMEVDLVEKSGTMAQLVRLIVGMTVGETKDLVDTTKGEDSEDDEDEDDIIDGASITLCELRARQLPELDDAFAEKVSRFATMAELKEDLRRTVEEQVEKTNKENRQEALLDLICEDMEVELPQSMVDQEMKAVTEDYKNELRGRGVDPDLVLSDPLLAQIEEVKLAEVRHRLQRNVALETVAKAEQIIVTDTTLDVRVRDLRKQLKTQQARKLDPANLRAFVKTGLLREKAMNWLEQNNTFKVRGRGVGRGGDQTRNDNPPPVDETGE